MRRQYRGEGIDVGAMPPAPFPLFAGWFGEAAEAGLPEPNAMIVATATPDGRPSTRTVLLKDVDHDGFVFYTNYDSRKGTELTANPAVSLLFPWHAMRRQVIVTGCAERVSREQTADYFRSRPRGSRIGAWASEQSSVVPGREHLEKRYAEADAGFADIDDIPVPRFWGGFRVVPDTIEFWQGRENRMHDRLRYVREARPASTPGAHTAWRVERLSP
ncbi:pyridoxamine 5'-phosphate oxidase [Streptomyces sp. SID3343]|uniref:pyridoxamine 5'-phosphate oxidase n=1 Tax=Streptomyces sp. SID3343 TaxID=2690260 RepID=UPI00136FFC22|nr:pyridoxamine 5'-phosphate oxidase [Streptomyces sp. SID3343]MYV98235.1 pyridoxamine 5'-phosphate oxidase [Streptomyces sp. SID3343]